MTPLEIGATISLPKGELNALLEGLRQIGYRPIGPRVRNETVIYDVLENEQDLPRGYLSEQKPGYYRLIYSGHANYFDVTPGPHSWKQFLFPPTTEMLRLQREGKHWQILPAEEEPPALAFLGVRPCELAAIRIQDMIFLREDWSDPIYRVRRERIFLLAVNCLHPCSTCFCASMGAGPQATAGFDLCLTELDDDFLVEIGSKRGSELMGQLNHRPTTAEQQQKMQSALQIACKSMGRTVSDVDSLANVLLACLDAKYWEDVARRCLSCANCTLVCPTCFCWDARDMTTLDGKVTRRERVWDSCFNPDYSYVVGGNSRPSTLARYRQWLIHKFATWKHQFGALGCVGCGRCITWCPAGIDVTEELAALRQENKR